MLAITVALVALLTPFFTQPGASRIVTGLDDFIVDLGYQMNRGHAVSVSLVDRELYTASSMRPQMRPIVSLLRVLLEQHARHFQEYSLRRPATGALALSGALPSPTQSFQCSKRE